MTDKLLIFIISWKGQHQNAEHIAERLSEFNDSLFIVFSDPDVSTTLAVNCKTCRRPNELFFSDKFKACLDLSAGNPILIVHADCACDDWSGLVRRCIDIHRVNPTIGVWAPKINKSGWPIDLVRIGRISGTPLSLAAQTDSICFCLSIQVIERLRKVDYSQTKFGWGIDWLMISYAFTKNLYVVVDESVKVRHPPARGYDSSEASIEMETFFKQFSVFEMIIYRLLSSYCTRNNSP